MSWILTETQKEYLKEHGTLAGVERVSWFSKKLKDPEFRKKFEEEKRKLNEDERDCEFLSPEYWPE